MKRYGVTRFCAAQIKVRLVQPALLDKPGRLCKVFDFHQADAEVVTGNREAIGYDGQTTQGVLLKGVAQGVAQGAQAADGVTALALLGRYRSAGL